MTRETKVGLSIAGTVFIVVGGALAYKLYFLKPITTQLAEGPTSTSSGPVVIPAKSETGTPPANASTAAGSDKSETFQAEIRTDPSQMAPVQVATAPTAPTTASTGQPPPPPILIEDKPPMALSATEKAAGSAGAGTGSDNSGGQVRTTLPPPPLPDVTPSAAALASSSSTVPSDPKPPPVAGSESPPNLDSAAGTKPAAGPESARPDSPAVPPPPALNPPAEPLTKDKPTTGAATAAASKPASEPAPNPQLPAPGPEDGTSPARSPLPATAPTRGNLASSSTPPIPVVIPAPPPSDAFDRSYATPPAPAALVANRDSKPRHEDAIPITVRPQTQPIAPPPPDAYPVKVAPQNASPSRVEVLDYEVQRYTVRPGDTWEIISRQKYGTERFAPALATYNRERDSRLAQLSVGATIFLPPGEILQRRYPHLLQAVSPNHVSVPAGSSSAPLSTPSIPARPPASVGAGQSGDYKLYRVQPHDTMWLIAKRTLGSGDRWPEIFRLNRDVLQDVNQIPSGTLLRLPPDARVDNAAAPR